MFDYLDRFLNSLQIIIEALVIYFAVSKVQQYRDKKKEKNLDITRLIFVRNFHDFF